MSYPLLLLILSLVVIVPAVFVVRNKSQQNLLANKNRDQKSIANHAVNDSTNQASAEQLQIASNIARYRSHPNLPISFRQLLAKIHSQYQTLTSVKLAPDQRFTVDKLAGTRLLEILDDYLALDKEYAQNNIIDCKNKLTSEDLTFGQLTSILEFMQRVQQDEQAQVASNILANRSYLQSVYGDFHQDDETNTTLQSLKAPELKDIEALNQPNSQLLIERGKDYLTHSDEPSSNGQYANKLSLTDHAALLGEELLTQLGQLTYTAEQTIIYNEALLANEQVLPAFDRILASAIPDLLRNTLAEHLKQTSHASDDDKSHLSEAQQALVKQKISRVQQLLEDCLQRLEKVAEQQYESSNSAVDLKGLQNTLKSKHSQAQYLIDSGFFQL